MSDLSMKVEINKLRHEAIQNLYKLFKIPEGFSCNLIDETIDCIVRIAVLEATNNKEEA